MVGHSAAQRLFTLDHVHNVLGSLEYNRIQSINPVSGGVDLSWSVYGNTMGLNVASNDHLLLTLVDRIDEFDTEGNLMRVIAVDIGPRKEHFFESLMCLLLQDSMYFHSAFHNLLSVDHRQLLAFEITQILIFAFDVAAYITAGRPTCKYF